jgi:hypothetical protein
MPPDPPVPAGGRPEVRDGDPCHRRRLSATPPAASWARATRRGSALSRFYRPARGGFALIWSRRRRRGSSRRRIASTFARLTRSSGSTDPMKLQRWRKWYPRTCDLTTRRSNQPKQYRISQLRCRRTDARKAWGDGSPRSLLPMHPAPTLKAQRSALVPRDADGPEQGIDRVR